MNQDHNKQHSHAGSTLAEKQCCHKDHEAKPQNNSLVIVNSAVIYTCPMHLEIRLLSPGNCPICGMALILTLLVVVLEMGRHIA